MRLTIIQQAKIILYVMSRSCLVICLILCSVAVSYGEYWTVQLMDKFESIYHGYEINLLESKTWDSCTGAPLKQETVLVNAPSYTVIVRLYKHEDTGEVLYSYDWVGPYVGTAGFNPYVSGNCKPPCEGESQIKDSLGNCISPANPNVNLGSPQCPIR